MGYIRYLNKCLLLPLPIFCLKFFITDIHNYSNYVPNHSERYLLSLGLNFRPTPSILSGNILHQQMDDFVRSVRIQHFFHDKVNVHSHHNHHKLYIKSPWIPPKCPVWIEQPLSAIRHDLCNLVRRPHFHKLNLSRSEISTLSKLRSRSDIRILGTDKNLGPALVTELWYQKEISRLLSDGKFYKRVHCIPFPSMKEKLTTILERYGSTIGDKLKSYILQYTDNLSPAHFKILPKVHKSPMVGRPIVASTRYFTTPASRFVDYSLAPFLPSIPSYIKDSSDFIRQLSHLSIDSNSFIVTADVTSLYTNIPIRDCIVAIDLFCRSYDCPITALITELTRFVLTNNYFEAEGVFFHQLWGLAMGTPMAVSAAIIYMASLERSLLHTRGLLFYKRFIDDIFYLEW